MNADDNSGEPRGHRGRALSVALRPGLHLLHDRLDRRFVVARGGDEKRPRELRSLRGPRRLVDRIALFLSQPEGEHAELFARSLLLRRGLLTSGLSSLPRLERHSRGSNGRVATTGSAFLVRAFAGALFLVLFFAHILASSFLRPEAAVVG